MSANDNTAAAWDYHDATKHTFDSVRRSGHMLDRTNQPRPWKLYRDDLPRTELDSNIASSGVRALDAIAGSSVGQGAALTLDMLGAVLSLSAGVTKHLTVPGGTMQFRAAACTGALYHIELYVVAGDLLGLPAGVYHYGVHDNALRRLRGGDFRASLAGATGGEPHAVRAQAVLVYTSTYWRNAWKYLDRAYRHAFWDSGTIIANALAVADARGLEASVLTGFADHEVNQLIGVDPDFEAAVALVSLGDSVIPRVDVQPVEPLEMATEPLSRHELDFPAIRAMHTASSVDVREVADWRGHGRPATPSVNGPLVSLPEPGSADRSVEEVIVKRGSSRRFERSPVAFDDVATMLRAALHRVPLDATDADALGLADPYLVANAVGGLDSGTYRFHRSTQTLELIQRGDTRHHAAHLALDQSLGGDAAFNVYFLADLESLLPQLGNRAYRAAHLDASIAAGRLYLAAYALGLGATGLTFYDDEVTEFFGPSAAGKSVMFLIAVGRRAGRGTRQ